jgi:hypothetical protein
MDGISCDICNKALLVSENVRYEVRMEVKSAYDVMDIVTEDLYQQTADDLKKTLGEAEKLSQQEAEDEIYKAFKFDLCLVCQREFIKDPLSKWKPPRF